MMKNLFCVLLSVSLIIVSINITNGQSTLKSNLTSLKSETFGNEWIDYDKTYYKIKVANDGLYRVSFQTLENAALPMSDIAGADFKMYAYGKEYPIFVTTDGTFEQEDYLEFYGKKNRGEIDAQLYTDPVTMQLNPEYSMFNDTMVYFLTWEKGESHTRVEQIDNDLSGVLPSPEPYYMAEEKLVLSDKYNKPIRQSQTSFAHFDIGEGFGGGSLKSKTYSILTSEIYEEINDSYLTLRTGSNFVSGHVQEVYFNNNKVESRAFANFRIQDYNIPVLTSDIKAKNKIKITGAHIDGSDRFVPAHMSIIYPRKFVADDTSSFNFRIAAHSEKKYIELKFDELLEGDYIIYDKQNNKRIIAAIDSASKSLRIVLEPSSEDRDISIIHESIINSSFALESRSFVDIQGIDASYLILSSEKLRNDANGEDWPQRYADFRSSSEGGNYRSHVINVEDLYDQFCYGIERHVLAIRNMGMYLKNHWGELNHVFIIGKGLDMRHIRTKEDIQENGHLFYVPTFGSIGPSDNLLFTRQGNYIPEFAVGRIAAITPQQVSDYLDKAIDHANVTNNIESEGNNLWSKNILHLGGGSANEKETIKNHLINMKKEIEENEFGGEVTSFYKYSSENVSELPSEQIISIIDNGVAIITFFGHSAVGTLDYSLEQADAYNNKGKYPIFLSLGCLSGNIHTKGTSGVSEDFVLTKDKGSVAFIASSGSAFLNTLFKTAKEFYTQLGSDKYGESIGTIFRASISNNTSNYASQILYQQQILHGDPGIRLYPKRTADYTPSYSSVKLIPNIVNAALDSFKIAVDIFNLGRAIADSIYVKIEHSNQNEELLYSSEKLIATPKYKKNYLFNIPLANKNIIGKNKIKITLDSKNYIDEYPSPIGEDNNKLQSPNGTIGYDFFIIDNNLMPVSPSEFGIVSDPNLELLASSSNIFLEDQKYIIQIDTSEYFQTVLAQTEIIQGGGLLSWKPGIDMVDEQVYYWRVSPDSTDTKVGYIWNTSSFVYLKDGNEGWNQSHYFQFKKDHFHIMDLNEDRKFDFGLNLRENIVINAIPINGFSPKLTINGAGAISAYYVGGYSRLCFMVVDSSGNFWKNINYDYGSSAPWENAYSFYYDVRTFEGRRDVINFLENEIPPKSYVYAYTMIKSVDHDLNIDEWAADSLLLNGKNLFNIFKERGAILFDDLKTNGSVPYTFIFRNGYGALGEKIAKEKTDIIIVGYAIEGRWHEGEIRSKLIGPALSWNQILWDETLSIPSQNDTTYLSVYTTDAKGVIIDTIFDKTKDKILNIDFIDAKTNPYIKLVYYSKDSETNTTGQLEFWKVHYTKVPELVLYNDTDSYFHADSIYQGDELKYTVRVKNITNQPMDSLLVKYTITTSDNSEIIKYKRKQKVSPYGGLSLDYKYNTSSLIDDFTFKVEINPEEDQTEQYQFNNLGLKKVKLLKDNINPILDVSFDGIHIMDYDIVSPLASIRVQLNDNSPYMLTDDVDQFSIILKDPNGNKETVIMTGDKITFFPATNKDNEAYLIFKPELKIEGDYILYVSSKDASGNISGENNYQVNFKVILEQKATQLINYPNPFSTSTQFIFTLTGAELPENMKIQIMSVSGRVVKEITMNELGDLHIGLNKSEYLWDGTDDFGERLANGVYFYKVKMKKSDGEEYEIIETSIDQYYKEGWGKLVIMR